ncbi:MAG: chloride channel protein [Clostridia bacterium]|nr:chloride channel protein [Clostridia bacterium]
MKKTWKSVRLASPIVGFGAVTGVATALVVVLYKLCAKYAVRGAELGYHFLREHLWCVPLVLAALGGVAWALAYVYRRQPNVRGGGIPTSIGILRDQLPFKWLPTLIGTFVLSLVSFVLGVPLGNEGPSVQIGTAIGRGTTVLSKRRAAWDRYAMTGGACAGFAVATGAPISGVLFAVEEGHRRVSATIFIAAVSSVVCAGLTSAAVSPMVGVSTALFEPLSPATLSVGQAWLSLAVGAVMGLFAVAFLRYYQAVNRLMHKTLKPVASVWKIWAVLAATVLAGVCSFSCVSTGHELMHSLLDGGTAVWVLAIWLVVRVNLTLCANTNGLTGGIFLPLLALGALVAAMLGEGVVRLPGMGQEYYTIVLVLGITGCIAGMMRMPLTAIVFAVEALSGYANVLHIILTAATAFIITELFKVESINDSVLENRVAARYADQPRRTVDTTVTVQEGSFAVGREIREILWPHGVYVLSVKRAHADEEHHGLCVGDVLHVRYTSVKDDLTRQELITVIGEQVLDEEAALAEE